jgi:hypothetical protein
MQSSNGEYSRFEKRKPDNAYSPRTKHCRAGMKALRGEGDSYKGYMPTKNSARKNPIDLTGYRLREWYVASPREEIEDYITNSKNILASLRRLKKAGRPIPISLDENFVPGHEFVEDLKSTLRILKRMIREDMPA